MKFLLLLLIALPLSSFSQSKIEAEKKVHPLALFTVPEFIGGQDALTDYIDQHFKITKKDVKFKTNTEIIVKFFIGSDGSISKASILKGASKQLDKEVLRVISEMPNWIPGTQNGKNIETMYTHTFKIG